MNSSFAAINLSKANFDEIYTRDDPRAYFSVLGSFDYMIPDLAEPVLRQLLAARAQRYGGTQTVLDVGCSYGINAAVHRFPLSFGTLRNRYARHEMMALSPEELARLDRHFYSAWPEIGLARFIGLDASAPAIRYARSAGLIDRGICVDLERTTLAREDSEVIRRANVILSTGCVGYVTEKTYAQILQAADSPPWVVSFVLRMFPYDQLSDTLSRFGLVTERLGGATFVQRRFRDVQEFSASLEALAKRGIDTAGFESDGLFQADLYVSRPPEDVRAAPLEDIITITSGRNRPVGTRYVQVETERGLQIALEP
jgi:SAM-dependent methyltransferase